MSETLQTASPRLAASLRYEPRELRFGTSGRRGLVVDLTQLEIYINVLAELQYLQQLPRSAGGIAPSEEIYLGYDLRPSSTSYVPEQGGRGEIAQAVVRAIRDAGMHPVNVGKIPTPAVTYYALAQNRASVMVTGSHIPFDRNGYKMNTSKGELLKEHESPIAKAVERIRAQVYGTPRKESPFDENGRFKMGSTPLPPEDPAALAAYIDRYISFFNGRSLAGKRILVYQHSAVGRDILCQVLEALGASVIPAGRSEHFVPIDTENIDAAQLQLIQTLTDEAAATHGALDAVVSVDGDSDRPLVLGVQPGVGQVKFFGGDLVGMIVAAYLKADAVVVPISCNDAIDRGELKAMLEPKTRIGSPYVIAGIEQALAKGKTTVCGWEANGGFLLGSNVVRNGRRLGALPTRDALLPILCILLSAQEKGVPVTQLFASLPRRFSRAALLKNFPRPVSLKILELFSSSDPEEDEIHQKLGRFLTRKDGFGSITSLDYTDGLRITFENGDVVHIRPSGNADELRVYAVADTQERSDQIASLAIAEPDGILRRMEQAATA
jgi:phosphomannomutase